MAMMTVTDLVLNFAEACRALAPALDRAGVPWLDADQYDNWDRVAEPLFQTLVLEPCAFQAVGEQGSGTLRLARYGFAAHECDAWIIVADDRPAQLISLSSVATAFDHVRCGDPSRLVPLLKARFAFVCKSNDGAQQRLDEVNFAAS